MIAEHVWVPVELGHSNYWCKFCKCTPKEACLVLSMHCKMREECDRGAPFGDPLRSTMILPAKEPGA